MAKYEKDWDGVWKKNQSPLHKFVNLGRSYYNKYFFRVMNKQLQKDTEFCELGCGTSAFLKDVAPKVKSVIGVDISDEALALSRKACQNIKNANFVKDDCTKLKIASNSFDLVWSQGLIEHFNNPEILVKQHIKICKKGGCVMISVPYKYSYIYPWYIITRPKIFRRLWPWTDQDFYTPKKWKQVMSKAGKDIDYKICRKNPFLGLIIAQISKR